MGTGYGDSSWRRRVLVPLALAALAVGSIDVAGAAGRGTTASSTGPAADVSEQLSGGAGVFVGEAVPPDLESVGFVEEEYVAAGTAIDYQPVGALTADGVWSFTPGTSAPYRTRVLVRRPAKAKDFSGTAVVEWMNVSGGVDANPDWTQLGEEITRRGHAWVGVTTQLIGVEGGPVLVKVPIGRDLQGKGLKGIDPARYGSLVHPGDGYSFDIFTQVARALRKANPVLGNRKAKRVIAAGESQSAIALTTYYDGVQPLTHAFDGFFVHSRGSTALPLVAPGKYADLASSFGRVTPTFRTDLDAPVLDIQAEGDVASLLRSYVVRQPDSDTFRLWEIAGSAHADARLLAPGVATSVDCGAPVNDGPMHFVAKAALRALDTWVRTGKAPPKAPRIELTTDDPAKVRRNADGIALGGIRTPVVDVPVDVLSGDPPPNPDVICILSGSTIALSDARVAALYPSRGEYLKAYRRSLADAVQAGFVLPQDRAAMLAKAQPERIHAGRS